MELRPLLIQEMSEVSASWVTDGNPACGAIQKEPMLNPLLPELRTAHDDIVAVGSAEDPSARQLSMNEAKLDARHDDLVRAIHGSLTVLSKFSKAGEEMVRLRDLILPEGLRHSTKSYRAEAGHTALVASWMTPELQTRMKAVLVGEGTLLDLVNQWIDAGRRLGVLEEQRGRLDRPAATPAAQVQAARRRWIRWANILLTTAENAGVSTAVDTLLFGPLRAAAQNASSRWGRHDEPAPAPPVVPPVSTDKDK